MLFCLSSANIIHFHNYNIYLRKKIKYTIYITIQFCEIHNYAKNKNYNNI